MLLTLVPSDEHSDIAHEILMRTVTLCTEVWSQKSAMMGKTDLVLDYCHPPAVILPQNVIEECGLATPKEACQYLHHLNLSQPETAPLSP